MEIEIFFDSNKKINARIKEYIVKTDQPLKSGGDATAPSPFDLFLSSIGTCTGFYVKSFCDERNIPTENIKIIQRTEYDKINHLVTDVNIEISLPPDFPEKYKNAVLHSADACTVKRHLQQPPKINIQLVKK